jgi:hypothetical protein
MHPSHAHNNGVKTRKTFKPWTGGELISGADKDFISGRARLPGCRINSRRGALWLESAPENDHNRSVGQQTCKTHRET